MAEGSPLLVCQTVSKLYGALAAVDSFSLSVARGEILGIGGPNGAGKTTLFDVISGIAPATVGRVLLEGTDITRWSPDRICRAGLLRTFQMNAAFDSLSIRENVEIAAYFGSGKRRLYGLNIDRAAREAASAALDVVSLGKADRLARDLPVLDRKLLMIASALAAKPKLVMLDEPVGGLAPGEIDAVVNVVRATAATGVTVILIEHVMRFLLALSERVVIMHQGKTLFEGPPRGVAEDRKVAETYLGTATTARLKRFYEVKVEQNDR